MRLFKRKPTPDRSGSARRFSSHLEYARQLPLSAHNIGVLTLAQLNPTFHRCRIGKITLRAGE